MRKLLLLMIFAACTVHAQEEVKEVVLDDRYREDQFYVGISFNILEDEPVNFVQSGFSGGVSLGFIRDMPLNERRNIALGVGFGWSFNTYNQNLFIGKDEAQNTIFRLLDNSEIQYNTNRFNTYLVEVPIEFRWRTSTAAEYKFWRVYAGVKFGYLYYFQSKFEQPGNTIIVNDVDELNRIRTGATLSLGRGNFNLNLYYSLNPFFDAKTESGQEISITTLKVGIIFYIL